MMPGLHPGLLLAVRPKIEIEGAPQSLHINTAGGPGTRVLGVALELKNAPAPFHWEFDFEITGFNPVPASGFGTSNNGFVYFETQIYHEGAETALTEVGLARFRVTAANGASAGVGIVVTAGGTGTG